MTDQVHLKAEGQEFESMIKADLGQGVGLFLVAKAPLHLIDSLL